MEAQLWTEPWTCRAVRHCGDNDLTAQRAGGWGRTGHSFHKRPPPSRNRSEAHKLNNQGLILLRECMKLTAKIHQNRCEVRHPATSSSPRAREPSSLQLNLADRETQQETRKVGSGSFFSVTSPRSPEAAVGERRGAEGGWG